ncbi:MAG: DUF1616 domain-containing protein [Candidatus Odinarchaeota archaeon]
MKKYTQTVLTILMFGIVFATGTLLVSVWILPPSQPTPAIALLNENMEARNYPTNVTVNTNITLNIEVYNFMGWVQYFFVRTKLANSTTMASATTPSPASLLQQNERIVSTGGVWRFPVQLNMTTPGLNYRLTFELWQYDSALDAITYTGVWIHLPLNVTGP